MSSFSLKSHRDRYRQKQRKRFFKILFLIGFLMTIFITGFQIGRMRSNAQIKSLKRTVAEINQGNQDIENELTRLRAENQTLTAQYNDLDTRYNKDVPRGNLGLVSALAREQLDKGIDPDRLAFIIRQAQPPQNCTQPTTKRFILNTEIYKGPDSAVSFADGAITVTGTGKPTVTDGGAKEAWFDPGKPVTITFTKLGGKNDVKEAMLPIHHTIILNDREHRFTVSKGPRSFVVVTGDSCDYLVN